MFMIVFDITELALNQVSKHKKTVFLHKYRFTGKKKAIADIRVLLNPRTHQPPTHLPTDPILTDPIDKIPFKRLENKKINIFMNPNTAGKMQSCT